MVREIYYIRENYTTTHARLNTTGPLIGSNIARLLKETPIESIVFTKLFCIVFTSPDCPLCKKVGTDQINRIRKFWEEHYNIVEIVDVEKELSNNNLKIYSTVLFEKLAIKTSPYVIIVDSKFNVVGNGLVNNMVQIENLLETTLRSYEILQ
jgi:thiol-disulfide isomerase/thioredoxin